MIAQPLDNNVIVYNRYITSINEREIIANIKKGQGEILGLNHFCHCDFC